MVFYIADSSTAEHWSITSEKDHNNIETIGEYAKQSIVYSPYCSNTFSEITLYYPMISDFIICFQVVNFTIGYVDVRVQSIL